MESLRQKFGIVIGCLLVVAVVFGGVRLARAAEFNPNLIITDQEITDTNAMSLAEIQKFLEERNSFLATYQAMDYYGATRTAAEIIYNAATNNYDCSGVDMANPQDFNEAKSKCPKISISPRFLIVLLQKEQSLIESNTKPKQSQLDWAVGYGCPDNAACGERWRGFGKQVNAAALQFYDYIVNPRYYRYQVGQVYTVTNTGKEPSEIIPANKATAALYNYTPHVYNGNYNFWKLWQRYFTQLYPDGSLLQAVGEETVYLVQSGRKRPFSSKGALVSRFDLNKIVAVRKEDLNNYPDGTPIKFQQYSLVQAPSGAIYLLVDDKRRGFTSQKAFAKMGFNKQEVVKGTWEELAVYKESTPITATSTYPTGALLQDKKTGGVYWVEDGGKFPVWDRQILSNKFAKRRIIPVDDKELAAYKTGEPVKLDNGSLIKVDGNPNVYLIDRGQKRQIASERIFNYLGYNWANIITVNAKHFELYANGPVVEDNLPAETSSDPITNPVTEPIVSSTVPVVIVTSTESNMATTTDLINNAATTTATSTDN